MESSTDRNGTQDEPSGDIGGTQNVIYVNPGNWLNYAVTAPVAGTYVLSLRASNGGSTAGLQVRNSSGRRPAAGSFLVEAEDYIAQNNIITEASSDVSGTLNTVHSTVGSWADYRITVPVAGTYTVKLRVGSTGSGILKLRNAAGADLATLNLASTGGLQQYTTVEASVSLSGGTQTLRLYTEGASFTVNRLEIVTPPGTNNYALQLNNHPANGGGFISDAVNDFTVEFWIKAAGTHQIDVESNSLSNIDGVAGQRYAIFPVHGYGSGDAGMGVSVGTNGVSVYEHADGYMPPLLVWESSTPMTDWTHVAIVYRNRQPSLYINGNWVKDGQVSQKNNVYGGLQFPGGHYGGTGGEQMDEVRVWKYARTEQQIRDNRQGEILGTTPGLAGYWPMNEGSGTVLHDISGNGRDIDLSSAGYNNSNWVSGRYTISNQEDLYRYAFNGKEKDSNIGEDNYDYGARIYDARLGRWYSTDIHVKDYLTPYSFARNAPIDMVDPDGNDEFHFHYLRVYGTTVRAGADGILHTYPTVKMVTWVSVLKDNASNTFYVHKDIAKSGEKFSPSTPTQFFPTGSPGNIEKTGITSTTYLGFITRPDDDYTALLKTLDDFPELEGVVDQPYISMPSTEDAKRSFWSKVYSDKRARATAAKEDEIKAEFALGVATVVATELVSFALASGEGMWLGTEAAIGEDLATLKSANNLVPKQGWFDVVVHGDDFYVGSAFSVNGQTTSVADVYKMMLDNGYKEGTKIRLISCNAGKGAAQELSNLANTQVIAPTSRTLVDKAGKLITEDGSKYKVFNPEK